MRVLDTELADVKLIEPTVHEDERGYFFEAFNARVFENLIGVKPNVCQLNESRSVRGTIRGLHAQKEPFSQAKLVRVVRGEILDVAVDCRLDSKTFGRCVSVLLSAENKYQLWIPSGFAHGFQVLSEFCDLSYQVDKYYEPKAQLIVNPLDKFLNIQWNHKMTLTMSDQDRFAPGFLDVFQRPS